MTCVLQRNTLIWFTVYCFTFLTRLMGIWLSLNDESTLIWFFLLFSLSLSILWLTRLTGICLGLNDESTLIWFFFIVFTFTFYSLIDKTDGYLVWPCTKCSHRSDRETLIWFADRWPSLPQMDSSQCWWSLYLGGQQKTPASMLGVKQIFCRK